MISYSETNVFNAEELSLLGRATRMVARVAEPAGERLRCHELARAVAQLLQLRVIDGKFGPVDHSWIVFPRKRHTMLHAILDVYAVGRLPMVQLVDGGVLSGNGELYKPGPRRADVDFELVQELVHQMEPEMPGWAAA